MPGANCQTYTLENLKDRSHSMGGKTTTTCVTTTEPTCEKKCDPCEKPVVADDCHRGGYGYGWGHLWVWLIIIWIIVAILLWLFQPEFLLGNFGKGDCEEECRSRGHHEKYHKNKRCLNFGNLILWSLGIAIVIVILVWLFRGAFGGYGRY